MSRLTLLHINIIGIVVCLIVGAALYFTLITGAQEELQKAEAEYQRVKAEADKLPTAKRNKEQALAEKAQTEKDYAVFNGKYMPRLGYISNNRIKTMMTVWWPNNGRSWPERFIRTVRAHMSRESRRLGVTWQNPEVLVLPAYGPNPNAIDMGDGDDTLTFGPYPMAVRGRNYQSLIQHIKSWNNISGAGVPVIDGVTLTGNSPNLVASYNVTFTVILKEPIPPTDTRITGGQGGQGGGFGGPRMGGAPMMGGPMSGPMGSSAMMGSGGMMGGAPMAAGTAPSGAPPAGAGAGRMQSVE